MGKLWPTFTCNIELKHRRSNVVVSDICVHRLNGVEVRLVNNLWWQVWDGGRCFESTTLAKAFIRARIARQPVEYEIIPNHDPSVTHTTSGPIIAYRGWGLVGDILVPLTRNDYETWSGPVGVAEMHDDWQGLYCVKCDAKMIRWLLQTYHPAVHGLVELPVGALVCEHDNGYRSTKQCIRLLRVEVPVGDIIIKALEERYQCDVLRA